MKIFGREPALWINIIAAVLSLILTLNTGWMSPGQATAVVAVLTAGAGVITAMHTRPWSVSLFTGFISTLAVLAAGYGLHVTVQLIATTVMTLIARGQITPAADPQPLNAIVPATPPAPTT